MTLPPTRLFLELHFPEPVDEDEDVALEDLPTLPARDAEGNSVGTSRIIGIEFPQPNIVRLELEVGDLVFAGMDYGDEHEELDE